MFADPGRFPRCDLPGSVDPDRAADGQHGVILERHQHLVVQHLLVVRDVVEDADHAEYQAVAVEYRAPFGEVFGGKDFIEGLYQLQRPRMTLGFGSEPGIGDKIFPAEAAGQRRPLPIFVEQREDEPASVLALVVVGDRVECMLARTPLAEFCAA